MNAGRPRRSPGWYQDPDDPTRVRHWNGRGWTGRRRPRPTWHVLPNDLAPDPNWVSPGGINGAAQRELLGGADADPAGEFGSRDQRAGGLGDRPLGLDGPPLEDPHRGVRGRERPSVGDPLGDNPLDRPLHADGPSHDWTFHVKPYRADRYRTGSRSSWAAGAAFGLEPSRAPRAGGTGSRPGGGGRLSSGSTIQPAGSLLPMRWRRSRVPLVIVVGLTLFAVVALLINLGTTARARFSAVSVDAAFVGQANVACATALGNRRPGSATVMSGGAATPGGGRPGTARSSAGTPASSPGATRSSGDATNAAPSTEQLARLTRLATQLGHLRLTPAAGPEVNAWLGDWHRYLSDERALQKADAAHDSAAASQDRVRARRAAADADVFAADNGLSACAIDAGAKPGFEPIP